MSTSDTTNTALVPWAGHRELAYDLDLADRLAAANLLPAALRQKPADLLLIMLHGRDLGLSVSQALRGLHIIEGKVTLSADLMVAMCLKRTDVCEAFRLVESTEQRATYEAKRVGQAAVRLSWTMEQAARAGLTGKGVWKSFGAAMLRARCASALARAVFPDVLFGVYDPEEMGGAPAVITATPTAVAEPVESARYAITAAGEAALEAEEQAHISQAAAVAPVAPERPARDWRAEIEGAESQAALDAIGAQLKEFANRTGMPEAERAPLRDALKERQAKGWPAPAVEPEAAREPGEEG